MDYEAEKIVSKSTLFLQRDERGVCMHRNGKTRTILGGAYSPTENSTEIRKAGYFLLYTITKDELIDERGA